MDKHSWVALPCAPGRIWAVPRACIGEILVLAGEPEHPPAQFQWRGTRVPVIDPTAGEGPGRSAGLVAVILGLRESPGGHWAVALRGDGLGIHDLGAGELEDDPGAIEEGAVAAFRVRGVLYQVPDLPALQRLAGTRGADPAAQGAHPEQRSELLAT